MICNLIEILEPAKLACEWFCRRDATLLSADTTISFMIDNLGSSYIAKLMKESLSRRMNERRTDVSRLLQYLYKGNQGSAELNLESVLNFGRMNKTTIIAMTASLVKPSKDISSSESDTEIEAAEEVKSLLSLQEKLDRAITDEITAKITSKTRNLKDITSVVKKELINFEIEGKRGPNLEKAYNDLNTIPPASVEAERVFSDCGNFGTKIRSSLNDESLDMLSFLKSYFKSDNLN
jgi:hypothetical protein